MLVRITLALGNQREILLDSRKRDAHVLALRGGLANTRLNFRQSCLRILSLTPRLLRTGSAGHQFLFAQPYLLGAVLLLGAPLGDLRLKLGTPGLQAVA